MPKTYRTYDYDDNAPYVGRVTIIENYLDKKLSSISIDDEKITNTIEASITESLGDINCKFHSVHHHIEDAKNEIIENQGGGCMCNIATKKDIADAVKNINTHVDEKFNEVDFLKQFSDLNEQIAGIKE